MRKRGTASYRSKVTVDTGLTRGRVPCPLLNAMGARPGDQLVFRLTDSGEAIVRVSRSRAKSEGRDNLKESSGGKGR